MNKLSHTIHFQPEHIYIGIYLSFLLHNSAVSNINRFKSTSCHKSHVAQVEFCCVFMGLAAWNKMDDDKMDDELIMMIRAFAHFFQ